MKNDSARDKAMDKLVEAKLRSGLEPGGSGCLDAEILSAYVEHSLTARERANCASHLASCARCQEQVATLVRLSEADEPAGIQTKTGAPARGAGIRWFRWAWAGPALAAVLVVGIYLGGPFRQNIQQIPGPENKVQEFAPSKTASSPRVTEGANKQLPSPAASGSSHGQENQPAGSASLDSTLRGGATAGKPENGKTEPAGAGGMGGFSAPKGPNRKAQSEVPASTPMPAPQPPPAPNSNRVAPAAAGAIATPSQRAALAKDERAQGAGMGGSNARSDAGGDVSPETSNKPTAHPSVDNLATNGGNAETVIIRPAPPADNEKTRSRKSAFQDEAKAKKEAQTTDKESANLHENERDNQQVPHSASQTVEVTGSMQQVMVAPAKEAQPGWRVGRHGLIQELDAQGKWKKRKSGVKADLNGIAFSSPSVGWVVGQAGTVLRTTDGGTTWSRLSSPSAEDLVQVTPTSDLAASVVTRSGRIFSTIDGGATWSADAH